MRSNRLLFLMTLPMMMIISACATDQAANEELHKEQSEKIRDLGGMYLGQGSYTDALRELLKAEELYGQDPVLQNYLGLTYLGKKRPEIALMHFKKAVQLKPDYSEAINNMGTAYLIQKQWKAAITVFSQLLSDLLYTTPHYPLANIGWAYFNLKQYSMAEKYYLDALRIQPNFSIALRGLGKTYLAMGKTSSALLMLEKAIKISPAIPEIYLDLADAYSSTSNYAKAIDALNDGLGLVSEESLIANEFRIKIQTLKSKSQNQ
jgi:type IV pilus assembly protein PilF